MRSCVSMGKYEKRAWKRVNIFVHVGINFASLSQTFQLFYARNTQCFWGGCHSSRFYYLLHLLFSSRNTARCDVTVWHKKWMKLKKWTLSLENLKGFENKFSSWFIHWEVERCFCGDKIDRKEIKLKKKRKKLKKRKKFLAVQIFLKAVLTLSGGLLESLSYDWSFWHRFLPYSWEKCSQTVVFNMN